MRSQDHNVRKHVHAGRVQLGSFIGIPHPAVVEIAGRAKLDFVAIDAEHGSISREGIENLIRAADAADVAAIVRVPVAEGGWIGSVLDAGASGVLVPLVSNAAQAQLVADLTRYPPMGKRGCGPGRATGYGAEIIQYLNEANETVLVAIQIETVEGVENIAEIAAIDGIDVIFIGPGDLAVSLGAMGEAGGARLNAAIDTVATAARSEGKALGIFVQSGADVAPWAEKGFTFIIAGSDVFMMHQAYANLVNPALADPAPAKV